MEVTPIKREKLYNLIVSTLKHSEGMTAREIASELYKLGFIATPTRQETAPRLTELEYFGRVEVCGSKIDERTHKNVSIYRLIENV